MKHNPHLSNSLIAVFCKKCKKMFYRDGDLMSFSSDYASKNTKINIKDIKEVETYMDWLIYTGELCESCIPPMPQNVRNDIQEERERRNKDILEYQKYKDIKFIPGHQPIQDVVLEESYIETIEDRRKKDGEDDSINRPPEQREGTFREKISRNIPNAIHVSGGHRKR